MKPRSLTHALAALCCAAAATPTQRLQGARAQERQAPGAKDAVRSPEQPAEAGASGYPTLPAVSAILGSASQTLKSISSQAKVLQSRISQTKLDNEVKMSKQKAIYEDKLRLQEEQSRSVAAVNLQVSNEIAALKAKNGAVQAHAKGLKERNALMRTELQALKARLGAALEFVTSSLKLTDDSNAPEIAVLEAPGRAKRRARRRQSLLEVGSRRMSRGEADKDDEADDEDDDNDDDDADDEPVSNTTANATSADNRASNPEDPDSLLVMLSRGVAELQKQEQAGETSLNAAFLASFEAGTRRHVALVAQQRALNATRASLLQLQKRLLAADWHLAKTRVDLKRRLRGVGLFAQRLAHLALAPAGEAPRLLVFAAGAPCG